MIFKEKERTALEKRWKAGSALKCSMNFVAAIQLLDQSQQKTREQLSQVEKLAEKKLAPTETQATEEDFIEVTYRAISAAMLADRPIDFSNEGMLKKSAKLLQGQTVFKDHYTSVDNWVGRIVETFWDTDTKDFPPGINARLRLDAVKDPMAVRGVLQGAIHSASVTVSFEWKPSHPKLMDEGNFFPMLGEEVDGELVRVIVTKIDRYLEISLVWQGADKYAKQIDEDGKPVQKAMSFHQEEESFSADGIVNITVDSTNEPVKEEEMKLAQLLKEFLGVEVTEENLKENLEKYVEAQQKDINLKVKGLESEITSLNTKLEDSKNQVKALEELKADAELGKKYLKDQREKASKLCKLAKGESVSPAILKTLETSSLEVLEAWIAEFEKEVEDKYPSRCAKCNSTKISKQSSVKSEEGEEESNVIDFNKEDASRIRSMHI